MRGTQTHPKLIETCVTMRQNGASLNEICKTVGLAKSTVFAYIKPVAFSQAQKQRLRQNTTEATIRSNQRRKGVSQSTHTVSQFPAWNENFIYHISHFFFDGAISYHRVEYYNRSITLVKKQKEAIDAWFNLDGRIRYGANGVTRLTYASVDFSRLVNSWQHQILTTIPQSPHSWKVSFLKAFFDDEGNIYVSKDKRTRRIRGYQHDETLLSIIQKLLASLGIQSHLDPAARGVVIRKKENLVRFAEQINFSKGVYINPQRKNSLYDKPHEKRKLLQQAIESYQS